jgi:MFS family permease
MGFGGLGIASLIAGFLRNKIALIVFRALMGIGAALTIPSALHLIVHLYTEPKQQERAVAAFGGSLTLGIGELSRYFHPKEPDH